MQLLVSCSVSSLVLGILRIQSIIAEARKIKYAFTINKYAAQLSIFQFAVAIEYPQVQSGGINAVAMATPGIMLLNFPVRV